MTDVKQFAHNARHLQQIVHQTKNWLKTCEFNDMENLCEAVKDGCDTLEELYEAMTGEPCGDPDWWEPEEKEPNLLPGEEDDKKTEYLKCEQCGKPSFIDPLALRSDDGRTMWRPGLVGGRKGQCI